MKILNNLYIKVMSFSLSVKIVCITIFLATLPLIFNISITNNYVSSITKDEFSKYSIETVRQVSKSISLVLNEVDNISYAVSNNDNVQRSLSFPSQENTPDKIVEYAKVNDFLNNIFEKRVEYSSILIFGNNAELYYKGKSHINYNYDFINNALKNTNTNTQYIGSHERQYINDNKMVFSVVKKIHSIRNFKEIGYIIYDINYSFFNELINSLNFIETNDIMIVDNDEILYSKNSNNVHRKIDAQVFEKIYSKPYDSTFLTVGAETFFYTYYPINDTNWKVVSVHSLASYNSKANSVIRLMLVTAIFSILLTSLVLAIISSAITRPLKKLELKMYQVQNGNFNIHFMSKFNDEIGKLGNSFNFMVSKLNSLIQNVYEAQIAEKNATIYALQSQINPHFIYNTLQSISDFAECGEKEEVSAICQSLSSIFRYSIEGEDRYVHLFEEIEHVKNYIYIQSIRLNNRFKFDIDIPAGLLDIKIPRLILQPIIENSISHGIYSKFDDAAIHIHAYSTVKDHCICIRDNGTGIEPAKLDAIIEIFARDAQDESSENKFNTQFLGLNNINRRLILNYGKEYRLTINSIVNIGTEVIIRIPNQNRQSLI